jgi:hypothetical protein
MMLADIFGGKIKTKNNVKCKKERKYKSPWYTKDCEDAP